MSVVKWWPAKAMYCAVHGVDRGRSTGRGSPGPKTFTCGERGCRWHSTVLHAVFLSQGKPSSRSSIGHLKILLTPLDPAPRITLVH